jgi:hypothetical protein
LINKTIKDASVFGIFGCIVAMQKINGSKSNLSKRESPILLCARGQAQVMCNLYVENVPEGGMDIARHRDLLNNTLNILSSFNLLWTEP